MHVFIIIQKFKTHQVITSGYACQQVIYRKYHSWNIGMNRTTNSGGHVDMYC